MYQSRLSSCPTYGWKSHGGDVPSYGVPRVRRYQSVTMSMPSGLAEGTSSTTTCLRSAASAVSETSRQASSIAIWLAAISVEWIEQEISTTAGCDATSARFRGRLERAGVGQPPLRRHQLRAPRQVGRIRDRDEQIRAALRRDAERVHPDPRRGRRQPREVPADLSPVGEHRVGARPGTPAPIRASGPARRGRRGVSSRSSSRLHAPARPTSDSLASGNHFSTWRLATHLSTPTFFPAFLNAATAISRCSRVCAADTWHRTRACPCGTTG